ncbi:hypothetical protein AGMMS49545_15320 [Betaproteobacteria bacterium]|nr:hypothetical protein AGMMS49545_15320 [Betaproteobacteria bacterium]GHU46023.1 hypothetical protein AGMMS50289_18460 [Betaproteobacteria bacterium]
MNLEKKSVHVRLSPEMHERLSVLSGRAYDDVAEHAGYLLEKMIVVDWYVVSMQASHFSRLGLTGMDREREG